VFSLGPIFLLDIEEIVSMCCKIQEQIHINKSMNFVARTMPLHVMIVLGATSNTTRYDFNDKKPRPHFHNMRVGILSQNSLGEK
jgi:hypothetical protein